MVRNNKSELHLNIVYNILSQIVVVLSPLVVTPKISRIFGVDYIGIKSYTFSIVYYFAIFGVLGLDMYGQRKIALDRTDVLKRSRLFFAIYTTRFFMMFFITIIYLCVIEFLGVDRVEKTVLYCWVFYLIREMINPIWFLQGIGKYQFLSILNMLSQAAYVICTLLFVNKREDLPLYIIFYTVIPLLISLCYYPIVIKNIKFVRIRAHDMLFSIKESVVYFVPTIATAIYSMVDKTMLGAFDAKKISTGLYESSERLVKVAIAFSTASFTIMRTRMSYLFGLNDEIEYQNTSKKFISFSLMLCWPIMFGVIGIAEDFVPVFFGDGFERVIPLSKVFALVIPCLTISGLIQSIYIFPYGLQKNMDVYYAIIVTVNVLMNLLLIWLLGALGAIISTIIAEMLLAIIMVLKARRIIEVKLLFYNSIRYIIASFFMVFVMICASKVLPFETITKLIIEFVLAVISYFACCLVLKDGFVWAQTTKAYTNLKSIISKVIER